MSLSKPKQETPLIEPFQIADIVATIERQATEIEKLRSENELKLKQENDNLQSLLSNEQKSRSRAEQRAEALERELKAQGERLASSLSAEVDKIAKRLPSSEAIAGLSKTF